MSIIVIGVIDYYSGAQVSMMLLYAVPILVVSWYCGRMSGMLVAALAASCWLSVNVHQKMHDLSGPALSWNAATRLGIFLLIAYSVSIQAQLKNSLLREKRKSRTDQLTGLLNNWAFRERVEEELDRARRYNRPLTLAFIDLDNFKQVNDTFGHARGDKLLKEIGKVLLDAERKTDIVGRIGGDEFAVCFPETNGDQARKAVAKLVATLDIMTSQSGWQVTTSIGVVTCLNICETFDSLLGKADRLMYQGQG